ncbi:ATP/GTP-binding protein [Kocuria koreensis]|uniref:ATP/GTP-binding protein n=1 Tax=Rothia koreensis TaxID=592378 RepID=A0A7K1LFW6_9MICC|nr:ATP/GTP-binding protein [Rothia koreensis]MUN54086.1 ATP/GTP-binding protein [Rothia koreensis]
MARSRRNPRRTQSGHGKAGPSKWQRFSGSSGGDISRALDPAPRIERDELGEWYVRYVPASGARKPYTCPGCGRGIPVGTAHYVVWKNDHLFGDQRAIEDRRHWHARCWEIR